ncbi:MAG: right-handed parallel beta-helix repeat-containing protein [Rudaea sp.]|uniref:parallel beta-helix domain-containing protein n=1 Tax=unclassified Rudaea TaxID=2627037 RepID=UPI0010FA4265|nr:MULTISPECIES: parallel beta-helix domain-containing protein [unclassified Rudaea]MBN8887912.1 right-handed parallel beta-helix repeat-containing protein [Rudaea sp.]MBR0345514.1 right-handed parallel beta-helix repeat-containing protein [Rudaea sp.]
MRKLAVVALCALAAGCGTGSSPPQPVSDADAAFEKKLQEQFLDAKPGTVIEIPPGKHQLQRVLTLRANGVTVRGAGADKSILSFKNQVSGPEGMLVYANDFTIEHLAIEDSKGDGLKINDGENITIRDVRVEWTAGPSKDNGAYAIYPVKCKNVLIEDSVAIGSRDAGIYVGQSQDIVVRRNRAEKNVAGIEIENSIRADVYENNATGNTGGILVFNMPDLTQHGEHARVYKNKVIANNLGNFGAKGTAVASVPAGSGIIVTSNPKVEIFDNDIADNRTANVIIASYYITNFADKKPTEGYDPYPKSIYIYGNRFSGGGDSPDGLDWKALKVSMFGISGHFPDVLWDGFVDTKIMTNGQYPAEQRICVQNGEVEVLNVDGPNKFSNPKVGKEEFHCELPKLAAVELKGKA